MIAGEWWTPVGKNADKLALRDVPPNMSFREVRKAKTFERSFQEEARAIEHKLALDTNVELSPVLFELPRVEAATVSRQAKIEAVVVRQVLRCLGPLALGEVGGRAYHGHLEVGLTRTAIISFATSSPGRMPASTCCATMFVSP